MLEAEAKRREAEATRLIDLEARIRKLEEMTLLQSLAESIKRVGEREADAAMRKEKS